MLPAPGTSNDGTILQHIVPDHRPTIERGMQMSFRSAWHGYVVS